MQGMDFAGVSSGLAVVGLEFSLAIKGNEKSFKKFFLCNFFLISNVFKTKEVKHMDSGKDIRETVIKYSDTLYKVCIVILCNEHDVQDAIQDTFCRYLEKKPEFRDEEHEKAWLIRVATNICRDMIRFRIRHPKVAIDEVENTLVAPEQKETLKELLELPVKHKTVIYLHYVEGYPIKEIADILGITESAVKSRLLRGRKQMRDTVKMEGGI